MLFLGLKGENAELSNKLFNKLLAEFPDHLPLLIARLQCIHEFLADQGCAESIFKNSELAVEALGLADKILNLISQEKLLAYYGLKTDSRPDSAKVKT
jgi:hypothetical protein